MGRKSKLQLEMGSNRPLPILFIRDLESNIINIPEIFIDLFLSKAHLPIDLINY